jgi:hypothetical protein
MKPPNSIMCFAIAVKQRAPRRDPRRPRCCLLNRMPGPALASTDASVALRTPSHQRQEGLLRLHGWISAWRARRRNDFEMTAARRRDLHVSVNPGRRADDSLRSGEFVAEWSRTATAHRWRLALDIGRACRPFLGRWIPGRLRQRHICHSDADERCNDQDGGTQRQLLTDLRSVLFNVWAR